MDKLDQAKELLIQYSVEYGPKLLLAIITLIVGLWLIKKFIGAINKVMDKKQMDSSLKSFVMSLAGITLKILLFISVMSMVGIAMTSFVAILAAAGFAIGMALSGTLQNFAGGVMILIFKPFKVGDFIEAQGYIGVVKEIQIFITTVTTVDNKTVIIPNGPLSTGSLINYSTEPTRRIDFTFGIAYGDDVQKARQIIMDIFDKDEYVLKDPAPFIGLVELADSSVNLAVRPWVKGDDYWDAYFQLNEKVYNAFNENGINIPFPQMDVHLQNQK
jgi:small conductance mechanosensitive channel